MGFFNFLGLERQDSKFLESFKENIKDSFHKVHSDLEYQKNWIAHMYHDLKSHKESMHSRIDSHADNIENLTKWINYLNESNQKLKRDMTELEKNLYTRIRKDFVLYNQQLLTAIKAHYESMDIEALRNRVESLEQLAMQRYKAEEQKAAVQADYSELRKLNTTQQKIINMLYSSSIPLSYETIAMKLDISVISARVYIKRLKDLGYDIETNTTGKKALVTLSNKEKIDKFYKQVH
jgi:biotin operon repressor